MKLKVTLARLERVSRIGLLLALMPILTLAAVPVRAQTQVFPQWVSSLNGFTTSDVEFDEAGNKYAAKPMASDSLGNTYIVGSALGEMLTIKQRLSTGYEFVFEARRVNYQPANPDRKPEPDLETLFIE